MTIAAVWLVAAIHVFFADAEIRRWPKVTALLLGYDAGMAAITAKLGINQGAYNAFFAIGLVASLVGLIPDGHAETLIIFCLAALALAGTRGIAHHPALGVLGAIDIGCCCFDAGFAERLDTLVVRCKRLKPICLLNRTINVLKA